MTLAARMILTLMLAGALVASGQETTTATPDTQTPAGVSAQTETASNPPATTTAAASSTAPAGSEEAEDRDALSPGALRERFISLLNRHPEEVGTVLSADPTLLSNDAYLQRYPDLADFIARHPEIRRNPHYYGPRRQTDFQPREPFEEIIEALSIAAVFALITFALGWFIRTIIEQKRWNWLSRRQTEVHNKILDRFSSTAEVLDYIRTPAGTKFLESAPIPLHAEPAPPATPRSRVLWSLQAGVVAAVAGFGMMLMSIRYVGETAQGLFGMGGIAFCIGAGFIASALVSIVLSKRLGVGENTEVPPAGFDDPGVVR